MTTDAALDRRTAAAIVHAEQRRDMLRELAQMGMTIARELSGRVASGDKPRLEPAPPFEIVARSIRLTLMLEARMEEDMLALCRGELPHRRRCAARPIYDDRPEFTFDGPDFRMEGPELRTDSPRSQRLREEIAKAAEQPFAGLDQPEEEKQERLERLEREYERLVDSERYDHRVFHSFRDAVAAVCDDLRLAPMWSTWSEETGFPRHLRWDDDLGWVDGDPEPAPRPAVPSAAEPTPQPLHADGWNEGRSRGAARAGQRPALPRAAGETSVNLWKWWS